MENCLALSLFLPMLCMENQIHEYSLMFLKWDIFLTLLSDMVLTFSFIFLMHSLSFCNTFTCQKCMVDEGCFVYSFAGLELDLWFYISHTLLGNHLKELWTFIKKRQPRDIWIPGNSKWKLCFYQKQQNFMRMERLTWLLSGAGPLLFA